MEDRVKTEGGNLAALLAAAESCQRSAPERNTLDLDALEKRAEGYLWMPASWGLREMATGMLWLIRRVRLLEEQVANPEKSFDNDPDGLL